jgi:hypothetical protein
MEAALAAGATFDADKIKSELLAYLKTQSIAVDSLTVSQKDSTTIKIVINGAESAKAADAIKNMPAADKEKLGVSAAGFATTEGGSKSSGSDSGFPIIPVAAGAGGLLLVILAIVYYKRKKGAARSAQEDDESSPPSRRETFDAKKSIAKYSAFSTDMNEAEFNLQSELESEEVKSARNSRIAANDAKRKTKSSARSSTFSAGLSEI